MGLKNFQVSVFDMRCGSNAHWHFTKHKETTNLFHLEEELNKHVEANPEKFLEFLLWLTFTVVPNNDENKERMRTIKRILLEKITFID